MATTNAGNGESEKWSHLSEDDNGEVYTMLNETPHTPRGRSKSLKHVTKILMPEVGTASELTASQGHPGTVADDLYISEVTLRRNFAAEFLANLEVRLTEHILPLWVTHHHGCVDSHEYLNIQLA